MGFLSFATALQAQQDKKQIPKVNLDNFSPPAKTIQKTNKMVSKKNVPKVDLTNFKLPTNKNSGKKKD